ncbi:MAG: putative LPS assembly protein LptD [Bacteroidia bacterium]|nr:putative LPS assembly protein LptD [Bacteroidia bacterium]
MHDTIFKETHTLFLDSLEKSSEIKAPIKYSAEDSIVFDIEAKILYLYKKAHIIYQTTELEAERAVVEWNNHLMHAFGITDTGGNLKGAPIFKERGQTYHAEKITYNFKTQKGRITWAKTNQNGDIVIGETIKRNPDNSYFVRNGKFTTCDHEDPHFYIQCTKLKVIPQDRIISGPLYMVILDVPIPIIIPFGFFPFRKPRASGILIPIYGEAQDRGFFFREGGYYWAINDYWDLKIVGDLFTKGGYRIGTTLRYRKLYGPSGSIGWDYSFQNFGEPGDPGASQNRTWFFRWDHQQRLSPTTNLTANVSVGSSNYLRRNSFDNNQLLQNNLASSVSLNKHFRRAGWNVALNFTHRQELTRQVTSINFPELAITMANPLFLFKRRVQIGQPRWYETINLTYNSQFANRLEAPDSLFFSHQLLGKMRNGMVHNWALNTNLRLFKYIVINPGATFTEYWYFKRIEKFNFRFPEDSIHKVRIAQRENTGFFTTRDFQFRVSLSTNIYGIWQTGSPRARAFRHHMIPTLSFSFRPDFSKPFWGNFGTLQDSLTNKTITYNRYEGAIFGSPGAGMQQLFTFSLNNNFQMRVNPKKSPGDTSKSKPLYVVLVDNLGISFSYNAAAERFKLSHLNFTARNNILNNKLNINLSARLDPYALDANGSRINELAISRGQSWLRLSDASLAIATTFQTQENKPRKQSAKNSWRNSETYKLLEKEYVPFSLPIQVNTNYTLNYFHAPAHRGKANLKEHNVAHSINLSGSVRLATYWNITYTFNFDFNSMQLSTTWFTITRDLHCWQLTLQVTPFGTFKSYFLTLNVKNPTLQDLRITKRRQWQDVAASVR